MKKRHSFIINIIFIGLMIFSASTVFEFMTGTSPFQSFAQLFTKVQHPTPAFTESCSPKAANPHLHGATGPQLQKLSRYQDICKSFVSDTAMVFFSMPTNDIEAQIQAKEDAKTLKEFATVGIRPLVIAEPTDRQGEHIDFALYADGSYGAALKLYFQYLKQEGLTDAQLGIWNPFPEANLPYWKNNRPDLFAAAVTNYLTTAREEFPQLKTSILLNSATYEMTDFNWESGDYNSLVPYVAGIRPGLIDYAGIQGFPWVSRNGDANISSAAEFLSPPLLTEMAEALGTKKIWFNTGTFGAKYTLNAETMRTIEPSRRKEILLTIRTQAALLKEQGYEVSINLFAKDKSEESEETNWSYWPVNAPQQSPYTPVLAEFVRDLAQAQIPLWLFDA